MRKTAMNHSIVEFENEFGFILNHSKLHSTIFCFNTERKILIANSKIKSKFHFDHDVFADFTDLEFSFFAKDFFLDFNDLIEDFNHTFNSQDQKVSEEDIISDIEFLDKRMMQLDKYSSLYACYNTFKKHISNI
jgi:hypothetical protein